MTAPLPTVRYAFYAFIATIPFETIDIGLERGVFSVSRISGYLFIVAAFLQPQVCFKRPPAIAWWFGAYVGAYLGSGFLHGMASAPLFTTRLMTYTQLLVLFWISCNLFQSRELVKGTFLAFGCACVVLSVLQVSGYSARIVAGTRVSALAENPNTLGTVLALGSLALLGLGYGREASARNLRGLAWLCFGMLATGLILTGSRGAMLGVFAGLLCLAMKKGSSVSKMKAAMVSLLAIIVLVTASYENETMRARWERAFGEGHLSRREAILPEAWTMFTEKPMIGWGPVQNILELGRRFGEPTLDPHNAYLWVLTETGLFGGTPFFIGLLLCWRAAWRARAGPESVLPMALLACLFIVNMSDTTLNRKTFWLVLAYAAAAGASRATVALPRWSDVRPEWPIPATRYTSA